MDIGKSIAKKRIDSQLTVVALSELLSIPKDRIYKWEKGQGAPKHEDRKKIDAWLNGSFSNATQDANDSSLNIWQQKYYDSLETNNESLRKAVDAAANAVNAINSISQHIASNSDAFLKTLEGRDEKLQSLLERALPAVGDLRAYQDAVEEHEARLDDLFDWILENLNSEEALRYMWQNRADRIPHDLYKRTLPLREKKRQDILASQGS
jgi:hypothetical protein